MRGVDGDGVVEGGSLGGATTAAWAGFTVGTA